MLNLEPSTMAELPVLSSGADFNGNERERGRERERRLF